MTVFYFAYGSNLDSRQLRERLGAARAVAVAHLPGFTLRCNKVGRDGTAKANIDADPDGTVWGLVWELDNEALSRLDRFEGGYERLPVRVALGDGRWVDCVTYASVKTDAALLPSVEYRDRMIRGAREHGLPPSWIARLEALPAGDPAE